MHWLVVVHKEQTEDWSVLGFFLIIIIIPVLGKVPFIHVGNQVVSELGPIVQFTRAKVWPCVH